MKIYKYLILPAFIAIVAISCEKDGVLTNSTQTDIFDEQVWTDSLKTTQVLTAVYSGLGPETMLVRINTSNSLSEYSDESDERWVASNSNPPVAAFQKGTMSASSIPQPFNTTWSDNYVNIRRANLFLSRVDEAPLSAGTKKRMKAEARFLRAYYYHMLMKHYAGVPIIEEVLTIDGDFNLPRNTYEECVNFVTSELDLAAADLPVDYIAAGKGQDYGRATRGACLALKARVLLFAASPLFNGGAAKPNPVFGYPSNDPSRWAKAADAAKAVMDSGNYSLLQGTNGNNSTAEGYYLLYLTRINPEMILARLTGSNRSLESSHLPKSRGGGFHTHLNAHYVNAFPMSNGKAITDPLSGYNPQNPYINRDPRFYRSVIYNGAKWLNPSNSLKQPVYTFVGEPTGMDGLIDPWVGINSGTGYYNRKCMSEDLTGTSGGAQHFFPFLRYGEILLNYAEAKNESLSAPDASVYNALIDLRKRAGITAGADGKYGLKTGMTQDEMRQIIRDERRIELSFEDHRFWDIRRWKIGTSTYGKKLRAMKIVLKPGAPSPAALTNPAYVNYIDIPTNYTYTEFDLLKPSVFIENTSNLLPIPQSQINISNKLIQNPGWEN
ncbi:Starch-binding associating with outer membrane [Flavobacterium fluvii]|uniref:Starch-binding associating with outer membrane n=1 Tax=Flavobacterium fluvii TaxID=468056 RepID=A0A1M5JUI7_9FLAO|nr:RagB/SusD family nutrient uptake outer membrane protein [Flavobacterium fluvii]SHG44272.1 Starch-binding associating with outer membrane [Flavobacterium fluvii]